jgi:uncharacterized protein YbjQ (UPF0145 family)
MMAEIIVTTAFEVPGKKILKILGVVRGNTIRSRNLGIDVLAWLRSLAGGEIANFTQLISQARDEAFNRMVNEAKKIGADAVIGMNFASSTVMAGSSEVLAYGTAVKLG